MYASTNISQEQNISSGTTLNNRSIVIVPDYKFYFFKKKICTGLYIGWFISLTNIRYDEESNWYGFYPTFHLDYTANNLSIGSIIGYQNYFRHFVFDFMLGFGYSKNANLVIFDNAGTVNDYYSKLEELNSGFVYRFALNVGYRF